MNWTVEVNHQIGGTMIKPSKVSLHTSIFRPNFGLESKILLFDIEKISMKEFKVGKQKFIVITAEDGGDQDYDDTVLTVQYLDTSNQNASA